VLIPQRGCGCAAVASGKLETVRWSPLASPGSKLTQLSLALVALTLLKGIALYLLELLMSHVGQGVVMDVRNDLYDHVLRQSMAFLRSIRPGV